jgi:hypothetical protein
MYHTALYQPIRRIVPNSSVMRVPLPVEQCDNGNIDEMSSSPMPVSLMEVGLIYALAASSKLMTAFLEFPRTPLLMHCT